MLKMPPSPTRELETLRAQWRTLYAQTLPRLALEKNISQSHWPVTLDHCFARIILDNTIAIEPNKSWTHDREW